MQIKGTKGKMVKKTWANNAQNYQIPYRMKMKLKSWLKIKIIKILPPLK